MDCYNSWFNNNYKYIKNTFGPTPIDFAKLTKEMEKAGEIKDLRRQVKYILIPAQREPDTVGKRGGIKKGKLLEREVAYFADFVYINTGSGEEIVEDTKGIRTTEYILKRKMMLYFHHIRIHEI